jgi:AhpD family alkylhydroperoxidase
MATPFRYVTPVTHRAATGRIAQVYAQLADDFGMARMPVFMTLSPASDVLAATWAAMRESLLAGRAPRTGKEVVAVAVSQANRCPFCVDAHTTLLHATGDHRLAEAVARGQAPDDPAHARLLGWAMATRGPDAAAPPAPADLAPEYIGTAMAFHFINRIASALLTDNLLPANLQKSRLVRSAAGRAFSRTARRRLPVGASLPLLAGLPAVPVSPWAAGTPIGTAFAVLRAAAGAGGELLSDNARATILDTVAAWDGEHPPMGTHWLEQSLVALPAPDRPAARLALLAALAPYRITDAHVSTWRAGSGTDTDLVRLIAFGAITATDRVEASITTAPQPSRRP